MSMSWAGYCANGLVLQGSDIDYFKKKYIEKNPREFTEMDSEEAEEKLEERIMEQETLTVPDSKMRISIVEITDDCCELPRLFRAKREKEEPDTPVFLEMPCWLILLDKQLGTNQILKYGYYSTYEEMEEELRAKAEAYLPDDFPYEERIGDLLYAVFA